MADDKCDQAHVEALESGRSLSVGVDTRHETGLVQLLDSHQGVVLVPTPSRDPKGN
jgi:hypothetical protein